MRSGNKYLRPVVILLIATGGSVVVLFAITRSDQAPGLAPAVSTTGDKNKAQDISGEKQQSATVSALGYLRPEGDVMALAQPAADIQSGNTVSRVYIKEGQRVSKGQTLIDFDSLEMINAERQALVARQSAISKQIDLIERSVRSYKQFLEGTAFARSELESRQLRLLELRSQLEQTKIDIRRYSIKAKLSRLLSPVDGRVIRLNVSEGEKSSGQTLVELSRLSGMEAVIQVDEQNIGNVRIGQAVQISSENGSFSMELPAEVSFVSSRVGTRRKYSSNPSMDSDAEERVFEVRARIDPKKSALVANLIGSKIVARFNPVHNQ